jgi:hypothetical protein
VPGTPIRILLKIKEQIRNIFEKKVKVKVYFNEWQPNKRIQTKFGLLKRACEDFLKATTKLDRN